MKWANTAFESDEFSPSLCTVSNNGNGVVWSKFDATVLDAAKSTDPTEVLLAARRSPETEIKRMSDVKVNSGQDKSSIMGGLASKHSNS